MPLQGRLVVNWACRPRVFGRYAERVTIAGGSGQKPNKPQSIGAENPMSLNPGSVVAENDGHSARGEPVRLCPAAVRVKKQW
jgi:hypothetical protein